MFVKSAWAAAIFLVAGCAVRLPSNSPRMVSLLEGEWKACDKPTNVDGPVVEDFGEDGRVTLKIAQNEVHGIWSASSSEVRLTWFDVDGDDLDHIIFEAKTNGPARSGLFAGRWRAFLFARQSERMALDEGNERLESIPPRDIQPGQDPVGKIAFARLPRPISSRATPP